MIATLQNELSRVNRVNEELIQENMRLSELAQVNKSTLYNEQNESFDSESSRCSTSNCTTRDEQNWATIIKLYQDQLKVLKDERDALRLRFKQSEPLQLPFHLGYNELDEIKNDGFSKRFIKTVKAAILVAIKKEDNFKQASASVIDYLRVTRQSPNWLCSFSRADQSDTYTKCH